MYEKAKYDILQKLGLNPDDYDEEFDQFIVDDTMRKSSNLMGEETLIMMDTYYNTN